MNEQIKEALDRLDPSNDNHWTGSGLPSVLIVSQLSGIAVITRKQIAEAYPGFNREMARIPDAQPEPEDVIVPIASGPKSLMEQRDILQVDLAEVQAKLHSLQTEESELLTAIERLNAQIDHESPPANTCEVIQTFLASQATQKKEAPTGPSPLDQAMARKRPTSRPSYPVVKVLP